MKTAILVDGGYYRKRAFSIAGDITAKELRTHTDRKFLSAGEHSVKGILEIICEAEKL